jgi:hypothetical protein
MCGFLAYLKFVLIEVSGATSVNNKYKENVQELLGDLCNVKFMPKH